MTRTRLARRASRKRRVREAELKALDAVARVLDGAAEDPEAFVERGLRFVSGLVDGAEKLNRLYKEDPERAKKALRNAVISKLADAGRKGIRKQR